MTLKEDIMRRSTIRHSLVGFASLVTTPLLLCISSSNTLYLNNQSELDHQLYVLLPFVGSFFIMFFVGTILYLLSHTSFSRHAIWAYYLAGPFFLLFSFFRNLTHVLDDPIGVAFLGGLFLIAVAVLAYRFRPLEIAGLFAVFGLFLIASETLIFFINFKPREGQGSDVFTEVPSHAVYQKLPNIYHILLDEYQTDMFTLTLSSDVKEELRGFIYFPANVAVYGRTGMSLPSIFTGTSYDYNTPQIEYQMSAFNSEKSILYWLKKSGYTTYSYTYPIYTFEQKLFDKKVLHKDNVAIKVVEDHSTTFMHLWVYSNMPSFITKQFLSLDNFEQIKSQNLLPNSAPIISHASFLNIMKREKQLSDSNRYTFIHLIIPHFPNVLHSDCSHNKNMEKTSPLEQARCATKIIVDFIELLKKLGRFENSLIIIQGDHGGRYRIENGELVPVGGGFYSLEWSTARSRALLLIKPIGRRGNEELIISNAESSVLDIAPTIFRSIGIKSNTEFEGVPLVDPIPASLRRNRYYHFYNKKGKNEWTDKMARFIISDGHMRFDKQITLENNRRYQR